MKNFLNSYFKCDEMQTNLRTELIAGLSTFLSLAYILVLNPAILSKSGLDTSAVFFATVIASGFTTILMGLWARLPFAVAPGLEMNGFFAFVVCGTLGMTWQQGLGAVFWSGILCIILTFLPVRQKIINAIPDGLKINIAVSVGVFVATIGLFLAKIVSFKNGFPDFSNWDVSLLYSHEAIALYVGLIVASVLDMKRFKFLGGLLVAIIVATLVCRAFGITAKLPPQFSNAMFSAAFKFDPLSIITEKRFLSVLLIFFLIDFYGGIGKFIGLTSATNLQSNGKIKNIEKALYVDGIGTVAGSALGTSSLITFVESAVGIAAGGRTGITAIVCGVLMLASLALTPLIGLVPVEATAGILIYVGWLLLPIRHLKAGDQSFGKFDMAVALVMGEISLVTFGLDKAMLFGFVAYTLRQFLTTGEKVNYYLLATTMLLILSTVMQYTWK